MHLYGPISGQDACQLQVVTSVGFQLQTTHLLKTVYQVVNRLSAGCAGFFGVFFAYRDIRGLLLFILFALQKNIHI